MRKLNPVEWESITSDLWILDTVRNGYKLEFSQIPDYSSFLPEIQFSKEKTVIVTEEIEKLEAKGAIKKVDPVDGQFVSNLFLVPKKDGSLRPVINLKKLNLFIQYQHFKQETISVALDLINRDDFLTSIDLTDAYFSITINDNFKKYLRFSWKEQLYEFQVMAFGLSSAPRIFTKILKPVYAFFRKIGICCIYYIDDSLCINNDSDQCSKNANFMIQKLENLGYRVNLKKSVLIPTKRIVFFGLIIDTALFKVFLTEEKIDRIISLGNMILNSFYVTIRCLASFIGLIVHAFNAVIYGPLHYRTLEREKVLALQNNDHDFDSKVVISNESQKEISWWLENIRSENGKPIRPNEINCWIWTDASKKGWGSKFKDKHVGGRWDEEEMSHHINYLELLAIFYSLQAFFKDHKSLHIGIRSDNTCAIAYVNEMGGMSSIDLDKLAFKIWSWCAERDIFITAQFIPGIENFDADHMSRNFTDSTEWKLKKEIFDRIRLHCFDPDIDLFASRLNCQLDNFVSWSFDPKASFTDAFSISWSNFKPYIFPPFSLIGRIVNKIIQDNVEKAILVVPFWPTQNWFPLILSHLISLPVRLPRHDDLVVMPHTGQLHPLLKRLNLTVCIVSGRHSSVKDFQLNLQTSSSIHGDRLPLDSMNMRGGSSCFGVVGTTSIPFVQLKRTF